MNVPDSYENLALQFHPGDAQPRRCPVVSGLYVQFAISLLSFGARASENARAGSGNDARKVCVRTYDDVHWWRQLFVVSRCNKMETTIAWTSLQPLCTPERKRSPLSFWSETTLEFPTPDNSGAARTNLTAIGINQKCQEIIIKHWKQAFVIYFTLKSYTLWKSQNCYRLTSCAAKSLFSANANAKHAIGINQICQEMAMQRM